MGWSHDDKPGARCPGQPVRNAHALVIDRHRDQTCPAFRQTLPRQMVAGIFEPHLIAPLDQCPRDQAQGALIASGHKHLARRAGNAAGNGKISGNRLAQLPVSRRVGIDHAG